MTVLSSRWFPVVLAVLQTMRYWALISYDYWAGARNSKNFDAVAFIREDLARPLVESYVFCGAWVTYSIPESANIGADLPAYAVATLLHSVATGSHSCVDALLSPRGQIIMTAFVLPLWLWAGFGVRRIAQRRWRRPSRGRVSRLFLKFCMIFASFGLVALLFGLMGIIGLGLAAGLRLVGFGFWLTWLGVLAAERLRVWPFDQIDDQCNEDPGSANSGDPAVQRDRGDD